MIGSVKVREYNLKRLWFISDRWFRILEFSLILATLYYFKNKTHSVFLIGIYWFSWAIFYMWFMEFGEFISARIAHGKKFSKKKKMLIWILSMIPVIAIYIVITTAANSIIETR